MSWLGIYTSERSRSLPGRRRALRIFIRGLLEIADGLVQVLSLGFLCSDWSCNWMLWNWKRDLRLDLRVLDKAEAAKEGGQ